MPTLEQQLLENKKEEIQHELSNQKFGKVNTAISNASVIAGFLAFFIVVGLIALFFVIKSSLAAALFIVWFYGGIALAVYLQEVLERLLVRFVHYHYELSEEEYKKVDSQRSRIWQNRRNIERDIQDRDAAIQREIKAEAFRKEREIYKEKELRFIEKLNNAVSSIQAQTIPYDDAKQLYARLLDEYATIKMLTYHSSRYYLNRFFKITSALNRYGSTTTNSIPRSRTIKLAVNKTEPVKNDEPITEPETPAIDKPIVKTVLPIINEKPVIDSTKTVEPFSPTYKPVEKIETSKIEKQIIKAEPSVIKENAGKTAETPMEELYSNTESLIKLQEAKKYNESLKIDYKKLYEKKQNIGSVGEIFAFEWEKRRLIRNGLSLDKLIHVSLTNDALGYDIVSVNHDGTTRFIEVKTTTGSSDTSFFMSESEKTAMEKLDNYCIYRLYYFDIEKGVSAITILDKKKEFDKYFNFQPISYRVSPK